MITSVRTWFFLSVSSLMIGCQPQETFLTDRWMFMPDSLDAGIRNGWHRLGHDRSSWMPARVATDWNAFGMESYDGVGWYATRFIPGESTPISVLFRNVDDEAVVWVNGIEVGDHAGYGEPFAVNIPDSIRTDTLELVVRVMDHGLGGGIAGTVSVLSTADADVVLRSPFAEKPARESAEWVRSAVVYEVYLRSFSADGTIAGLESRLQELQDIGVTVLWLMPIHPIGELNRKGTLGSPYAIMDYRDVNPEFGTVEDIRSLIRAAHERGMKVILDLVVNHTSWDNELLLRHGEWYTRDDEGAILSPNADWYDVADLNYDRHELRKYMLDMMRWWVEDVGVDGYRCDVAELVPSDFWVHARHELDGIKPVMMLAEGALPEYHLNAFDLSYSWRTYDVLDKIFAASLPASAIPKVLRREQARFPKGSLFLRFHTNHDKNIEDGTPVARWGVEGAMLAATSMFVLPGIPLVYNGEEVGNVRKLSLFEKVSIDWSTGYEMRAHYRRLGELRKEHPWLANASWRDIPVAGRPQTLLMMRSSEEEDHSLLAVLNFDSSDVSIEIPMPGEFKDRTLTDIFTAARIPPAERLSLSLPGHGFSVLIAQ